jgi:putative ABC transport system substrate-binding protein
MRRRAFLAAAAGALACTPRSRAAQRADPVIGYLYAGSLATNPPSVGAFRTGLAEAGYVEGRNVRIEYRDAVNQASRLPDLALDLVRRGVSVIAAGSGPSALAAKAATAAIPIVFAMAGDPIRAGLVASLNRPGGNVTGITDFGNELSAKRIELIKMLVPTASRVAILVSPNYPIVGGEMESAREDARALALETIVASVDSQQSIDTAFAAFVEQRIDGVCLVPSPLLVNRSAQVVALATRYRVPAIYPFIEYPRIGGLMSYGTSLTERYRQAGVYAGRILDGANPADLPVRRLTKFEFVINISAAGALGLTVPASLLALADQVIE